MTPAELARAYAEKLDGVHHRLECGFYVDLPSYSDAVTCTCDRTLRQGDLVRRMVEEGTMEGHPYMHRETCRFRMGGNCDCKGQGSHAAALAVRAEP